MNYRERLYRHYVCTHFASIREITPEALERQGVFFRAYFRRFLPKDKNAKVLDIGCGYGAFLYCLQKEGYSNVWGVDISPEQVEEARRFGLHNVHCEDLRAFLAKHPDEFDCITALDVVEHFPKEEVLPLLDAVLQGLKAGGTFIMQSPNGASPFFGTIRYADFTHELVFTRESVHQILSHVGFCDIRVFPTGPVVHGLPSGLRWLLWQMFRLVLHLYLAAETGVLRGHILTQNLIAVARKPDSLNPSSLLEKGSG